MHKCFFCSLSLPLGHAYHSLSESLYMDFGDEIARVLEPFFLGIQASMIWRWSVGSFWCLLHLIVGFVHLWLQLILVLSNYTISTGSLQKYQNLDLHNLRHLAIVVDSEEASNMENIEKLLHWLSTIGVKYVILYDMEGVLKKYMESRERLCNSRITSCFDADQRTATLHLSEKGLALELISFTDNKEGAAKAASFLCSKYLTSDSLVCPESKPVFTEADMADALNSVGCGGPEPELLLVYGPTRCHLGFPAWRLRYTEIVYMGMLTSVQYGAILKAIYNFSKTQQNYGS